MRPPSLGFAAMHDGNSGARAKFAIRVNEELVMTWVSSGETAGFEFVPLVSKKVHLIELRAVLGRDEWINLSEVSREMGIASVF